MGNEKTTPNLAGGDRENTGKEGDRSLAVTNGLGGGDLKKRTRSGKPADRTEKKGVLGDRERGWGSPPIYVAPRREWGGAWGKRDFSSAAVFADNTLGE